MCLFKYLKEVCAVTQSPLPKDPQSYTIFSDSPGMGVLSFNPSTCEAEAGEFLSVKPAWSTQRGPVAKTNKKSVTTVEVGNASLLAESLLSKHKAPGFTPGQH